MNYPPELLNGLKAFGFDDKKARIYLAGVELGPTTVLELSRRTRLPRTTLYPILEELRAQGFFRFGKQKKRSVYTAEAPANLSRVFATRERSFEKILPALEAMRGTVHEGAGVTLYEGSDGFRQLWRRIFQSGVKEYGIITSGVGLLEYVHEPYLVKSIIAERVRRGIRSRQLIPDTHASRKIIARDKFELRESRFLPVGTELPASIIVFGKEVAFITTRRENTMILIASGEAAITHRTIFELLWAARPQASVTLAFK